MSFNVVLTSPAWDLSGVNTFSATLIRGLQNYGIKAKMLITDEPRGLDKDYTMPFPADIPVDLFQVGRCASWKTRWQVITRYLEQHAPCIYIPNYDWRHSCVSPILSHGIIIVGIIHSDDPFHYDHLARLGKYWNAIVSVSERLTHKVAELYANTCPTLVTIPYGVEVSKSLPERLWCGTKPLRLIYAGRLVEHQKRIFDIPEIVNVLLARQIPLELTVVGDGADGARFREVCQPLVEQGGIRFLGTVAHEKVLALYEENDIFILTSEFEGMPVAVLEAMGRGCVPVVTDVASGIPELIKDGVNGYRIPVGGIEQFVECLSHLYVDADRRREMGVNAYRTICEGGYRTEDMVQRYLDLFRRVIREAQSGVFRRPSGSIRPPHYLGGILPRLLPASILAVAYCYKFRLVQFLKKLRKNFIRIFLWGTYIPNTE